MKDVAEMSNEEVAGLVCATLRRAGVTVTLTGGACVAIWSEGKYVSDDLDFVEEGPVPRQTIRDSLRPLGFHEKGRHFVHDRARFFIEFPTGPLMAGGQRIENVARRRTSAGVLRLLSPTDCVKDRLAAFIHWNDRQALEQAVLVARAQKINLRDVARWATAEGHKPKFIQFRTKINPSSAPPKPRATRIKTPQKPRPKS